MTPKRIAMRLTVCCQGAGQKSRPAKTCSLFFFRFDMTQLIADDVRRSRFGVVRILNMYGNAANMRRCVVAMKNRTNSMSKVRCANHVTVVFYL